MTHRLLAAALIVLGFATPAFAEDPPKDPTPCPMKQARDVSFRTATAKDTMQVEIGDGACIDAKIFIFIRTDKGEIIYKYEAPLEQHLVIAGDPVKVEAQRFVDQLIKDGLTSTSTLPPWKERDAYEEEHAAVIAISKGEYQSLRRNPRPMLTHPTYYEGWISIVYDTKKRGPVVVLEGGV